MGEHYRTEQQDIDWSRYPKLRTWFEHRPTINVWWEELCRLATELVAKGYAEQPTDLAAKPGGGR